MNVICERKVIRHGIFLLVIAISAACATPGVKSGAFEGEYGKKKGGLFTGFFNAQEADPMFFNDKARMIFLINFLDPMPPVGTDQEPIAYPRSSARESVGVASSGSLPKPAKQEKVEVDPRALADLELYQLQVHLQYAYSKIRKALSEKPQTEQMTWRNDLQGQLLGLSDNACKDFTSGLQRIQSDSSFFFGSMTTLLGGLGAIFTPAATARALSGAAGITAGTGAEYDRQMFRQRSIDVIAKGITSRRQQMLKTIQDKQDFPLSRYTLAQAVADVDSYHDSCTIVVGFMETEDALALKTSLNNLGLKTMQEVTASLALTSASKSEKNKDGLLSANFELNTVKSSLDKVREDAKAARDRLTLISTTEEFFLAESKKQIDDLLKEAEAALANADLTNLISSSGSLPTTSQDLYKKLSASTPGKDRDILEKELSLTMDKMQRVAQQIQSKLGPVVEKLELVSTRLKSLESPKLLEISVSGPENSDSIEVMALRIKKSCPLGCKNKLPQGETVELVIKPKSGYSTKISGDCSTSTIIMEGNKKCDVAFTR